MAITVHRSISVEQLADAMARTLREPMGMPFRKEVILVDGKALSNWLSQHLVNHADLGDGSPTRGLGVHMQAELMNTTRFANWAKLAIAGEPDSERLQDPLAHLATRIFRWLGDNPEAFALPADAGDGGAARLDTAQRLADWLLELIRDDPEWVMDAERKPAGRLESLWKALSEEIRADEGKGPHAILTAVDVLQALRDDPKAREAVARRLPGRIHLLATSDVSLTLLHSLKAMEADLQVHTYLLQPSTGFHLDLEKANEKKRIGYEHVGGESLKQGIPMETPGSLFLRQTAKHFRRQLEVAIDELEIGGECEEHPPFAPTVLGGLKEAIANFDAPTEKQAKRTKNDGTVSINRCHTPLREVEVLRDEILRAMSEDPSLKARDILVLSPDPETYAPLMTGVLMFRNPIIGFGTAGVEGAGKSPLADLANRMLELPSGRFTAQEILEICELSVIQERFGWQGDRADRVRRWFKEAPFFWGVDAEHRRRLTKEAFGEWSVADFLSRLSLGTALRSEMTLEGNPGTLPLEGVAGREGLQLAADLMVILETLMDWTRFALTSHSPKQWAEGFAKHVNKLLPDQGDSAEERVMMDRALAAVAAACDLAGDKVIDMATFRTLALPHLDLDFARGQFLSGGVTLAPLKAGNIHPAKMIAFLGLGDGSYPRRGQAPGPEMATAKPNKAQRDRDHSEQRGMHTIILAITAAQDRLVATFPGFAGDSGKDAAAALPIELIRMACGKICPEFRVNRHGLHSHEAGKTSDDDPHGDAVTTTRDASAIELAKILLLRNPDDQVPTPTLSVDANNLSLQQWLDFWKNPVKGAFERAQAEVPWTNEELAGDEPLEVTDRKWSAWKGEAWLQSYLNKHGRPAGWDLAKTTGRFPLTPSGYGKFLEISEGLEIQEPGIEPLDDELKHYLGRHYRADRELAHETTHFLRSFRCGSWLVLTKNTDEIRESDLSQGIAALAHLQGEYPSLRNVAVIGPHGPKTRNGPKEVGLAATNLPEGLRRAFCDMASSAISRELVLGPKMFEDAVKATLMGKSGGASFASLKPFKGKGDGTDRHVRLVLAGGPSYDEINRRVRALLGAGKRLTATQIKDAIASMSDEEAAS